MKRELTAAEFCEAIGTNLAEMADVQEAIERGEIEEPRDVWTIILDADGYRDEAKAETESAALLAARTLVEDRAAVYGFAQFYRNRIYITRNGVYDGPTTRAARGRADELIEAYAYLGDREE